MPGMWPAGHLLSALRCESPGYRREHMPGMRPGTDRKAIARPDAGGQSSMNSATSREPLPSIFHDKNAARCGSNRAPPFATRKMGHPAGGGHNLRPPRWCENLFSHAPWRVRSPVGRLRAATAVSPLWRLRIATGASPWSPRPRTARSPGGAIETAGQSLNRPSGARPLMHRRIPRAGALGYSQASLRD